MNEDCKKLWRLGMPCLSASSLAVSGEHADPGSSTVTQARTDNASPGAIVFGAGRAEGTVLIPGYNALPPMIKPTRDPELSLVALSGVDPTGPVMVEVPLVQNNSAFTASPVLAGWRIGYAIRYVRGGHVEPTDQRATLHRAFVILGQAGVQLVAVDAQRTDDPLESGTAIDALVASHRLDGLVSDDQSAAFHAARRSGYPSACQALEDGTQLWFYGARWAADRVQVLLRTYRQLLSTVAPTPGTE
ncbi:hypothetical protein C4J89_4076 [Pseudomonas sp. R4-35-07]|uniref:hypothetical protein n=1 Tax=Pseudomonas sp. R4-35-07 TaxID=658643 RepID=UPI000F7157CD|nr:hypothetical protein [Pseudomonas sp. R4-35-07]AZF33524.1 hypothetical protein C4J89_4076 [Pseudomonas sp. R4-35-07]